MYDLGYREGLHQVDQKIMSLDSEFDQILILEYLEEGLILLIEQLCWKLEDVVFIKKNARSEETVDQINEKTSSLLREWMEEDVKLYQFFLTRHRERVEEYGVEKMKDQVQQLRILNQNLEHKCIQENKEDKLKEKKLINNTAESEKLSNPTEKIETPKEKEKNNQKDVDPYFDINEWTVERKKRSLTKRMKILEPKPGLQYCKPFFRSEIAYTKLLREESHCFPKNSY
ncbi:galactosylceramide sulfotransferase [Eurytemora carolleeae]|uniref:galactosylceramide sulfotransferase n=1 Tax=Eurytemora carolleeae TaxID=1294199 RepID=UPI000C77E5FE|nr:galactosylceramide sulfotransferase [Eurytemora carolleeae]|eukprot:XP_023340524.1 galactosylceramide sulfotransferase-like [Eurytemora affinis]